MKSYFDDRSRLTMLEIHLYIIASDVRGHSNYWCPIELPNDMARRDSVEVRHDDVHQDHIILDALLHLVYCF
jgi:hypothetical protein